ncbi:MAG TPA: hypothetical protein VF610_01215 [Segetibacter sp.]
MNMLNPVHLRYYRRRLKPIHLLYTFYSAIVIAGVIYRITNL